MSEEIDKREVELSEQALEGVSGGVTDEEFIEHARHFCGRCSKRGCCGGSVEELAAYIKMRGPVVLYTHCPFWK